MMAQHDDPRIGSDTRIVQSSDLLDREWYLASYPEVNEPGMDPTAHFCDTGWRQGLRPNPYFHTDWYARTYGSELEPDENPLLHYIRRGERENAWPSPHFDPEWYRDRYSLDENESPLRHYLRHRARGTVSPLPVFDAVAYTAAHPHVAAGGQDPYLHWLGAQATPERNPTPVVTFSSVLEVTGAGPTGMPPDTLKWETVTRILRLFIPLIPFDESWYCASNPDVAAALRLGQIPSAHGHYIEHGFFEGRSPLPPSQPG
jgi:hypothetical protein